MHDSIHHRIEPHNGAWRWSVWVRTQEPTPDRPHGRWTPDSGTERTEERALQAARVAVRRIREVVR